MQYIMYVATSAVALGSMVSMLVPTMQGYEPVVWLIFYMTSLIVHIKGGHVFWHFTSFLGIISLLILVIYCLGSLPWVNIEMHAPLRGRWFVGGMSEFMYVLPLTAWFYVGVECLNLACNDTTDPKSAIPFSQLSCMATLFVMSLLVLFVCSSLPPGLELTSKSAVPLNAGKIHNLVLLFLGGQR